MTPESPIRDIIAQIEAGGRHDRLYDSTFGDCQWVEDHFDELLDMLPTDSAFACDVIYAADWTDPTMTRRLWNKFTEPWQHDYMLERCALDDDLFLQRTSNNLVAHNPQLTDMQRFAIDLDNHDLTEKCIKDEETERRYRDASLLSIDPQRRRQAEERTQSDHRKENQ